MRAITVKQAGGPEQLVLDELAKPEPSAGEIRVQVAYAPLNPLDTHARAERIKWQHPGFPFTPGYEYAGVVDAVGTDVDTALVGRRVAINGQWGGNAEYAIAQAAMINQIPDGMDWKTAACFSTCAYTAWLLIHSAAKVEPGQVVVIHSAAGAVGALTTQIAKSAGAEVIALAGGTTKLEYAQQFGADHFIDYNDEAWPEAVKTATNGRGADVIIDGVAGPHALRNLGAIAPLGNIIFIGAAAGQAPDVNVSALIGLSCSVTGFVQYFHQARTKGAEKQAVHSKLIGGEWSIPFGKTYSLDQVSDAHRAWESRELMGRTLIEVGGEL